MLLEIRIFRETEKWWDSKPDYLEIIPSYPSSHIIFYSLIQRDSNPSRYDIKSDLSLEEPGVIGPPFNLTFQVKTNIISSID